MSVLSGWEAAHWPWVLGRRFRERCRSLVRILDIAIGASACTCLLALSVGRAPVALAEPLQQATGKASLMELKAMRAALECLEKGGAIVPRRPPSAVTASVVHYSVWK